MAHYAFLDERNTVTDVIVGIDETELIEGKEPEAWYSEFRGQVCKRTSYSGSYRKNYAGIGYKYDEELDAFIAPQPFASWVLDEDCKWKAPIAPPSDNLMYRWDEAEGDWVAIDFQSGTN